MRFPGLGILAQDQPTQSAGPVQGIVALIGLAVVVCFVIDWWRKKPTPTKAYTPPPDFASWHPLFRIVATEPASDLEAYLAVAGDATLQDIEGLTALHYATIYDRAAAIPILLKYGADTGQRSDKGETPLEMARRLDKTDVVAILGKTPVA